MTRSFVSVWRAPQLKAAGSFFGLSSACFAFILSATARSSIETGFLLKKKVYLLSGAIRPCELRPAPLACREAWTTPRAAFFAACSRRG